MFKRNYHLSLALLIALGLVLRFWHLDFKPLWMDEVITTIFSFGKSYSDVPLDVVFPLNHLQEVFTFQPGVSCSQIAQNVARYSTHPPLFFCWMYSWLGWMNPLGKEWVEKLRSLPALAGVGAIVVMYFINRTAFRPSAGIMAAGLMAVSPFTVYLSQEARHYTLPMLTIALALMALIQILQDLEKRQAVRFWVWVRWAIINSLSFYIHYFCILAFIAQIATLFVLMYWLRANILNQRKIWLALILSISGVAISFLPWLRVIISHSNRAETDWLAPANVIAPFYQTFLNWILMVIVLPVEEQPLPMAIVFGLFMALFGIWIGWQVFKGLMQLWSNPSTHLATLTLLSFLVWVLLEFFAIVYFLNKDITAIPRYSFVYYPSFCALIAACLSKRNSKFILLLVGVLSCVFVISNLAFQKPFKPEQVAQNMNFEPAVPLMVVMAYRDNQDIALGLSFGLALEPLRESTLEAPLYYRSGRGGKREGERGRRGEETPSVILQQFGSRIATSVAPPNSSLPSSYLAFFKQSPDFKSVWQQLSQLSLPARSDLNLWVIGPGRKHHDYPLQVEFSLKTHCDIDPNHYYRIGVPYQLYRCRNLR